MVGVAWVGAGAQTENDEARRDQQNKLDDDVASHTIWFVMAEDPNTKCSPQ